MGNSSDNVQHNKQASEPSIKHPKLAKAKYINPKTQNQLPYLELTQQVQNRQIFEKWKLRINKYSVQPNQIQTIFIPSSLQFQQKGICGSSGIIKSRYIVLPYVLNQEILNRANINQMFLQKQLWYLLYILNIASATAHSRGLVLGDVRPQNVLMSQDGQICACCVETFLDDQKNYVKTMKLKKITYLAPQQIEDMQQGKHEPTKSQSVSQSFSVGLTILSAALLKDMDYLYGTDYTIDLKSLKAQVLNLRTKNQYDKTLKRIIQGMLAVNPKQRLTCQQVVQILRQYQDEIINLEDFVFQQIGIPAQSKWKLQMLNQTNIGGKNNEYKKVINNNDFNANSRVKYIQSPRNTQSLLYQQPKVLGFPAVINNAQKIQPPQHQINANIVPNPQNRYNPNSNQNNQNIVLNKQNQKAKQPKVTVTESLYAPNMNLYPTQVPIVANNPQFINQKSQQPRSTDSSHEMYNNHQRFLVPNRPELVPFHNLNLNQMAQAQNQPLGRIVPHPSIQVANNTSHQIPHVINNQIPNQHILIQQRGIQSPQVNSYVSKIDSYIPNQQIRHQRFEVRQQSKQISSKVNNLTKNIEGIKQNVFTEHQVFSTNLKPVTTQKVSLDFVPKRLQQFGREATSIRPPPDKSKDKIFQSYEEVMKDIDQKLRQSKAMFPDHM